MYQITHIDHKNYETVHDDSFFQAYGLIEFLDPDLFLRSKESLKKRKKERKKEKRQFWLYFHFECELYKCLLFM